MAAKPPKPPGNFLKSLLNQHNNNKNQQQQQQKQQQQQHQQNHEDDNIKESNSTKQHLTTTTTTSADINIAATPIPTTKKINCNCSNISIMHLFHEMKQEFPTIPDTIVAQCVNENCHQRENCIQMLKTELELNPIPVQSYPAKVLHPPNINHLQNSNNNNKATAIATPTATPTPTTTSIQKPPLQQKPLLVQQKPPLKPIRPIRKAPLQPPNQQQGYSNNNSDNSNNNNKNNNNCGKINSNLTKNTLEPTAKPLGDEDLANNEHINGRGAEGLETNEVPRKIQPSQYNQSISATITTNANINSPSFEEYNGDNMCINNDGSGGESTERNIPRQRPTTLNLNSHQQTQHQQRQRLNIQLQQRFQEQRNIQQQQQQDQQPDQQQQQQPQNPTSITKPIRKAPLPPIAPKPTQFQLNHTNSNVANNHLNDSSSLANQANQTTTSPLTESEISVGVSLSTPSPTSSLSPNTTTHQSFNKQTLTATPSARATPKSTTNHQHLQTKSPIRHRSVITLQPEPPYTRDFLLTPASLSYASSSATSPLAATLTTTTKQTTATNSSASANSSPTASVASSQKSFTSVNLTLRPPVSPNDPNSALQPSTIDITAGPGFSGASGGGKGLHYSSTSYDARLGYQQNFQITVTDECGVFSASRIRPQQQQHQQQRCLNQQQQQQQQLQLQQQFHNNVVALQQNIQNSIKSPHGTGTATAANTLSGLNANGSGVGGSFSGSGTLEYICNSMCLPQQQAMDAPTQEVLQRQKKKRDKLAAALREYKKRLGNVEQEINLLTGTIPTEGLSERLDEEIIKLRRDCQDMLRSSNTFAQPSLEQELDINYQAQQQQPQPFPRQKLIRPPPRPPPTPRQTSLDIIQHHSQISTSHTPPPAVSLPNLNIHNLPQYQQQSHTGFPLTSPPYYHHQSISGPINANFGNNNDLYRDHHSHYIDDPDLVNQDGDDYNEYEEVIEPWECNMCTFRNHPQLNICETCENVRIIPGRLTNLSRVLSTTNFTNTTATVAGPVATASTLDLLRNTDPNNSIHNNNNSRSNLNAANGNIEHDTNLVQQQLQHFALHT